MILMDGSFGEGGGQILRTSLALSLVTGQPFQIENIRAGRKKPGLMRQHLTAVNAAMEIAGATVQGNRMGSSQLIFHPGTVQPGQYHFSIGTAGSCTLVLQTVLPALLTAAGPSAVILEGGTHNPFAPPFDFLDRCFLPLINRLGPTVTAKLERHGFYPAGGGRFRVSVQPAEKLNRLELTERGAIRDYMARAVVSKLTRQIADRELNVVRHKLGLTENNLEVLEVKNSHGPGNILTIDVQSDHIREVFTGFGKRGVPAEQVAKRTVHTVRKYLAAEVPVGSFLADQLLVPMAIAGGGRFHTMAPTCHTTTNIEVLKYFLNVHVEIERQSQDAWQISLDRTLPAA